MNSCEDETSSRGRRQDDGGSGPTTETPLVGSYPTGGIDAIIEHHHAPPIHSVLQHGDYDDHQSCVSSVTFSDLHNAELFVPTMYPSVSGLLGQEDDQTSEIDDNNSVSWNQPLSLPPKRQDYCQQPPENTTLPTLAEEGDDVSSPLDDEMTPSLHDVKNLCLKGQDKSDMKVAKITWEANVAATSKTIKTEKCGAVDKDAAVTMKVKTDTVSPNGDGNGSSDNTDKAVEVESTATLPPLQGGDSTNMSSTFTPPNNDLQQQEPPRPFSLPGAYHLYPATASQQSPEANSQIPRENISPEEEEGSNNITTRQQSTPPDDIGNNRSVASANPASSDPELAQARPVQDIDHDTAQAAIPFEQRNKDRAMRARSKLYLIMAVMGILLLGAIIAGAVCGSGYCSNNTTTKDSPYNYDTVMDETLAPTTYNRDATEAANIRWEIQYVFGREYFVNTASNGDNKEQQEFLHQARQAALHWMLYEDPMQLESAYDTAHLIQRFTIVLFYFQTTRYHPWSECNPSSSSLCYRPEGSLGRGDIWGPPWLSGQHECQWAGIICEGSSVGSEDDNNVTGIEQPANQLNGQLPWELSTLSRLNKLRLTTNELSGNIPSLFGKLTELENLSLHENQLEGTLPASLFEIGSTRSLYFQNNSLTGPIPSSVQFFPGKHLGLRHNRLSGRVPEELYRLTNLGQLGLGGNRQLSGTIPNDVGRLTDLWELDIAETAISGTLPADMALWSNLKSFDAFNSKLYGTIPQELYAGLTQLSHLDISGSNFSGTISPSVGLWSSMISFYIADNHFTGSLPDEFGTWSDLVSISLNGNDFSSESVPQSICSLKGPVEEWELTADCQPDSATGVPLMACPQQCCTSCCDPNTNICLPTGV